MTEFQNATIGDYFDLEPGYAFKSRDFSSSGIPVIKIKNVKAGYFSDHQFDYVDPSFASGRPKKVARLGDLLISMSGNRHDGSPETWVGKVARFTQSGTYLINQRVGALRAKSDEIDVIFAGYLLSSKQYQEHFIAVATSSGGQANLSPQQILSAKMSLPRKSLQKFIAALLGSLDDKIELNRRMNETLEAMAQAIFRDWFVDFGPTRRKLEGATDPVTIMGGLVTDPARAQELADLFPATLGDDGLPQGWCNDSVRSLCASIENGGTPRRNVPQYWAPGTIPWLTSGEVREPIVINAHTMISDDGLANSSAKVWPLDTTVIAMYGATAGQVTILAKPASTNQACCGLRARPDFALYVYHLMRFHSGGLAHLATGAAQQNLSQKTISEYRVVRPIDATARAFEHFVRPLLDRRVRALYESETLSSARDLLLPKLMSGEIRLGEAEELVEAAQ